MPININGSIYYRTSEVCRKIDISRATLMRWLKNGVITEPARDRRGWRLFAPDDVTKIKVENNRRKR